MRPEIVFKLPAPVYRAALEPDHAVHDWPPGGAAGLAPATREGCRVLVTSGFVGASRAEMEALPNLGLVACIGTGYENVDRDAARERGIALTHGPGVNAAAVADHAMALLLALMRDLLNFDRSARGGAWRGSLAMPPIPTGKRLGIVGLGGVGERIARRAAAFEMAVGYHSRRRRPDVPWSYAASVRDLAEGVDCLVLAAPGGAGTRHMVDAAVLDALGPAGFLVNVGRGSIVDTAALIAALEAGRIAGAALDVFEDEPDIPAALRALPNVVLTPHVAGYCPEVHVAGGRLLRENIVAFLAGEELRTPVPAMTD